MWGYHLVLNLSRCNPKYIRCANNVGAFSDILVKRIDMKAFGRPQIVHFGEADKAGLTLVQLIETSNIMAHFSEDTNSAYIDVFSCKPYNPKIVEEIAKEYFQPQKIETTYLERGYEHDRLQ